MDSGGAGESYGLVDPRARQILLVAGVAGFVDHAEQSAEQVVFVVAGGDAHILGCAAAERWALMSRRPPSKSKPRIRIACRPSSRCSAMGKGPCGAISVCFACFSTAWLSREGSLI